MMQLKPSMWFGVVAFVFVLGLGSFGHTQESERWRTSPDRWLDQETVPKYLDEMSWRELDKEVLLFAGSSTAERWNAEKWFSDFRTANRGFAGSRIDDSVYFADQLLVPYQPSTIVFYAGTNDISQGKSPSLTAEHFGDFVDAIHSKLPNTQIVFVSIGPSIARWGNWDLASEANALIKQQVDSSPNLYYADTVSGTLGSDGRPRRELFVDDDLHLTELGYLEWSRTLKVVVRQAEMRYRQLKGCDLCGSQR